MNRSAIIDVVATRYGCSNIIRTARLTTLHTVRNLYFQHSSPFLTGSLSVECQSLLKVKVKDSVGLRPYSQLECSAAQLTESKGKGCSLLQVKVRTKAFTQSKK